MLYMFCKQNFIYFVLHVLLPQPKFKPQHLSLPQSFESTPTINTKGKVLLYLVGFGFFPRLGSWKLESIAERGMRRSLLASKKRFRV
jgi:hypothetical protein